MHIHLYQVDAFTDEVFKGNPACVMLLDDWLEEDVLLAIAQENAVAETAFLVPQAQGFHLRWFTPTLRWTFADTPPWPLPMSFCIIFILNSTK